MKHIFQQVICFDFNNIFFILFIYSPNIDFITPVSMKSLKTFFKTIKTIGPTNIPITPISLNPVYIAIIVNIG